MLLVCAACLPWLSVMEVDVSARLDLLKALGAQVQGDPSASSRCAGVIARHSLLVESGPGLAPAERERAAETVSAYLDSLTALLASEQVNFNLRGIM